MSRSSDVYGVCALWDVETGTMQQAGSLYRCVGTLYDCKQCLQGNMWYCDTETDGHKYVPEVTWSSIKYCNKMTTLIYSFPKQVPLKVSLSWLWKAIDLGQPLSDVAFGPNRCLDLVVRIFCLQECDVFVHQRWLFKIYCTLDIT